MNEALVIACGTTLFFGTMLLIIFGFFGYMRYLRYKETVVLAEKGLLRPQQNNSGKGALRWGIVFSALGLALCLGLYPIGFIGGTGEQFPLRFGPWMLFGLVPLFFGLGLVLIYYLTSSPRNQEADLPPVQTTGPVLPYEEAGAVAEDEPLS
jgi:hypothetical protein